MKKINTLIFILIFTFAAFGQLTVNAPVMTGPANAKVTIPITVKHAEGIIACQFILDYDPDVLTPINHNFGCETGDLAFPMITLCNVVEGQEGILRVVTYGATNFSGDGVILNVTFYTHKGGSTLEFDDIFFFDQQGAVEVNEHNGGIELQ